MSPLSRSRAAALVLCAAVPVLSTAAPALATGPAAATPAVRAGVVHAPLVPLRLGTVPTTTYVPEVDRTAPTGDGARPDLVLSPVPVSTWVVHYNDGVPQYARDAFQRAVDTWSRVVPSAVPIHVDAQLLDLGDPSLLGSAGPHDFAADAAGTTYVPTALLEASTGRESNPGEPDIDVELNSAPGTAWYYGTGRPSSREVDFTSVVLHELGHGLGLSGMLEKSGASGSWYGLPASYDRLVASARPAAQPLVAYGSPSTALGSALTSGTLSWTGALGAGAAGGQRPVLYSPGSWQSGSSLYHLDERTYPPGNPDSLMTPVLNPGEVIRDPGDIVLGMLTDLGYPPVQVEAYVDALYRDFLGRPAERGGLDAWRAVLAQGRATRYQVALSLATSDEYLGTVVSALYRDVLGREPDQAGLDAWRSAIRRGTPIATVGAAFYASPEDYARTGGTATDPGPWVDSLYRALLGRPSDAAGRAAWSQVALRDGRLAVTSGFYGSPETLRRRVDSLYRSLLGRAADPSGLATWPAVVRDRGDLALAASLASSAEYYDRAQLRSRG